MIGNETDARLAVERALPLLTHLGSTRTVYLQGNVVYKVESTFEDIGINAMEYRRMTTEPTNTGVFFPDVSLFDIDGTQVIAMEYIHGQAMAECYCMEGVEECLPDCMPDSVWQLVNGTLDDTGGFNVIVNERGIFIIDMG